MYAPAHLPDGYPMQTDDRSDLEQEVQTANPACLTSRIALGASQCFQRRASGFSGRASQIPEFGDEPEKTPESARLISH